MPLTSKGNKILASMRKQYGSKKGESIFYASKNKGTVTGVDEAGEEISGVGAESWVGKRSNSTGYRITAADAKVRIAKFVGDYGLPTPRGVDQSGTGKYHFAGQPNHATGDAQDLPLQALMDMLSEKLMGKMPSYAETRDRLLGDAIVTARPPGPRTINTRPTPQPNAATRQSNIVTARSPQEIAKSRAASTAGATTWNSRTQQGTRPATDDDSPSGGAAFHERQAAHFAGRGQQDIAMRHTKATALLHKAAAAQLGGRVEAQRHTQAAAKIANPVVRQSGDSMPRIKGQNPRFAATFDRWMNAPTHDQAVIARFRDKHTSDDDMTPPTDMGSPTTSDYGVKGMKRGYHMHTKPAAAPRAATPKAAAPFDPAKEREAISSNIGRLRIKREQRDLARHKKYNTDSAAVVTTRSADLPPPMAWARDTIAKFVAKRARTVSGAVIGGTGGVAADSQVVRQREPGSDITIDFFRSTMRAFRDPQQYTNAEIAPFVLMANRSMPIERWGEYRDFGECLFVAHFLVLAARANRVADAGGIPGQPSGVISSKGVGGASMSFDTQAGTMKDGGQWNTTSFGIQWLYFARLVGMGGLQDGGPDIPLGPSFAAPWAGVEYPNG